jgi:hypothetical protein
MSNSKAWFVLACLYVLAASVSAQVVSSSKGYLVLVKYKKGQVIKQNISMTAAGNSKLASNTQIITKCLSVDKNGIATLEVTTPTSVGQPVNKRVIKVDKHGRPVGNVIEGFSGTFMWPDKPFKLGQAWKGDMNLSDVGQGDGQMRATYKMVGTKNISGTKVLAISCFLDYSGQYAIAGTGTINIRVSDGQLHTATFNVGMKQFESNGKYSVLKLLMTIRTMP